MASPFDTSKPPPEPEQTRGRRLTIQQELEALAPRLSQATLLAAASRLSTLASSSRRHEAGDGLSPLLPEALSFASPAGVAGVRGGSDDDSRGSSGAWEVDMEMLQNSVIYLLTQMLRRG